MQKFVLRLCAVILFSFSILFSQRSAAQCVSIPVITCGTPVTASQSGTGVWNVTTCGFSTPGVEKVYSFTPSATGAYSLQVTSATGGYIDYFYKAASGGCSATGWTCIDDISVATTATIGTLTAGVQYYFLLDPEVTGATSHTFQIVCPAADPCTSITTLTCATPVTLNLTGTGSWNNNTCGFSTPGQEKVYSFTATTTGVYQLQVTAASGTGYMDYMFKVASGGCSFVSWTCIDDINFTGTFTIGTLTAGVQYYILVDAESTTSSTQTFQINCPVAADPCADITTIACATPATATLNVAGVWSNLACGFTTAGQEKIYSFTPTVTGVHQLQVTSSTGSYIDYMYKAASGGCSSTGWTCIDDISVATTATIGTLTAGVQYYILLDAESTASVTHTFRILCPVAVDPCTSITTLACATPVTLNLTGTGVWNNSTCLFSTPGQEKVYSFTPVTTGVHQLQVTAASGTGYMDYMYKAASGGCSSTGWTCIDDINFTGTFTIGTLTAGVQYYILVDAESTTSSTQTFQILCPVVCATNNWTGTSSNNWFTATNWSCGTVPTATTDVSIPSGTPNSPVITGGTAQVNDITIQTGATLTNNATLNINGGGVVVNNGTYKGTGAFSGALYNNNGGIVAPGGSPGCTSFGSGYTNGTGTEQIEIGGTTVCTQYDQLQVTGTATLSGTLDVILFGGYTPSCGESYKIMTSTTLVGTFTTINFPPLPAGLSWGIQYDLPNPGDVTLTVSGTPSAVATPSAQAICSGAAITTIVLNGSPVAGTTYNWTRDNTGTVTGIAASGSGDISGTLTNTTALPITVTFTVTPTQGSCTGTPITATVLVSAAIVDQTVTALPTSVCTGGSSTITVGASQPGVNYTLQIDPANTYVAGPTASNGPAINFATGPIAATTTYNVLAETDKYSVYLNGGAAGFVIPQHGALDLTNNFTIEGWIKPDNASGFSRMFNKSQAYALGLSNGQSEITFTRHNAGDFSVPYSFTTGVWYHIACTYVSGTVEFFVNGVSVGTVGGVPGIVTSGLGAQIGSESSAFHFFEGNIDNVRVWSSVRTQPEIAANQGAFLISTGNPTLAASWWIIEGSGNALDYSVNAINATSFAGTWQTDSPVPSCSMVLTNKPTVSINPLPVLRETYNGIQVTANNDGIDDVGSFAVCSGVTNNVVLTEITDITGITPIANVRVQQIIIKTNVTIATSADGIYPITTIGPLPLNRTATLISPLTSGTVEIRRRAFFDANSNNIIDANECAGDWVVYNITVNRIPDAVATPSSQTICSGATITTIVLTGAVSGTTFDWTRDNTGTVTGIAASGSGDISGALTNTTAAPITVTFTITPTANSCPGTPITATVVVDPTPDAIATPSSQTICSGATITTIVLSSATAGTTYSWTRDNTGTVTGIAASGSGDISGALTNTTNAPLTVTFTITPTANSCPGTPITATVSVNPNPDAIATPASQTICSGSAITTIVLTSSVSGSGCGSLFFSEYLEGSSNNKAIEVFNPTTAPVDLADYKIYRYNNGSPVASDSLQMVGILAPGAVYVAGNPSAVAAILSVSDTLHTITFFNGDDAMELRYMPTSTTLDIIGVIGVDPGTNWPVGAGATSEFTLVRNAAIFQGTTNWAQAATEYDVHPQNTIGFLGNHTINPCGSPTFDWTRDNTGTVTGIAANGSGDISGSLTNTTNAPVTVTFTVTATANGCPGTATTATVLVNPTATVNPVADQFYCMGATTSIITFTGPVSGTTFSWTNNNTAIGLGASGSGDIPSFTATNSTAAPITATITVTPEANGCPGTPVTFIITVTNEPMITSVTHGEVCSPGGVVNLAAAGNGTIKWYDAPTLGNLVNTGTTYSPNISSTTTYYVESVVGSAPSGPQTISMPPQVSTNSPNVRGYYFTAPTNFTITSLEVPTTASSGNQSIAVVRFTGAVPPPVFSATTNAFTTLFLTQNDPAAGSIPVNIPVNAGDLIGILGYRGTINSYGTAAPIIIDGNSVPIARMGMQFPLTTTAPQSIWSEPTSSNISRVLFTYEITGVECPSSPRVAVTGTVKPLPDATATPSSQTTCSGQTITTIALTGSMPGTVFNWTRDNTVTVTGIAASGSGDISGALTNTTASPVTVTFTITPELNGCNGTAVTATVLVYPTPDATATPTSQTICSGATITTIVLTGTVPGTVFNWTRDNSGSVTGIAASGSGDISGALTNTTNAPVTVTFTITPTASGCTAGASITATVLVNPTPVVDPIANQALCNGSNTTAVNFTSPTTGDPVTYNWTNNDPSIGLAASGTGNIASFIATNTTNTPVTATITVTPSTTSGGGGGGLIPEVLYYRFNGSGTSVPNEASAPPAGTNPATLMGGLTQGGTAICDGTIIGTGAASTTDYLNTGWAPNLGTGSWTISFKSENIAPSATLYYVFGDLNTNAFRCFTNGIAGANNWVLRGAGLIDVYINGGATVAPHTNTFVYDATLNQVRAYLDGVLVSTVAQAAPNVTGAGPFKFNGYSTNVGSPLNGHYDEFMVFNRALTPAEITTLTLCPAAAGLTCTGTPQTFTITVNPKPILRQTYNGVQVTANNDGTDDTGSFAICSSTSPNLFLTEITDVLGIAPSNKVKVEQIVTPTNVTHNLAASGTFVLTSIGPIPLARTVTLISPFVSGNLEIRRRAFFDDNLNNIIDANECLGDWVVYNVTVNPIPVVDPVANQVVCNNSATAPVNFTGPVSGTTFNWTNNDPSIGLGASGTGNIPSFTAVNNGTAPVTATITITPVYGISYTLYRTHDGTGSTSQYGPYANNAADFNTMFNTALSNTTVIAQGTGTASPLFNFFSNGDLTSAGIPAPGDYFGVDITTPFTAAESGVYTFGIDGDDGVDLSIDGVVIASFYGAHGFGGYQTGTISLVAGQTYTLRARMQEYGGGEGLSVVWQRPSQSSMSLQPSELAATACTGASTNFTITVNPIPVVNAVASQQICNGGNTTAINFTSPTTGGTIVYNWTNSDPSIGLAANGSGDIASFVATNAGNAPVTATIIVTPSYTNAAVTCVGAPITFTITVYPTPQVDPVANQVICNNASTAPVNFTSPTTGGIMSFNWVNNTPSIGLAANGSGNIPSFVATNASNAPVTATITVTPVSNNAGNPVTQTFNYTGAVQTFTVPPGVTSVTITSAGAQGGTTTNFGPYPGGMGATMSGTFTVTPGQVLEIIVGGRGNDDPSTSGGGGGSGVNTSGTALIVAGGGAGVDFQDPTYPGIHAVITANGVDGNAGGGLGGLAGADGNDNIYSGSHISRGGRGWSFNSSGSFGQNGVSGSTTTTNGTWGLGGGGGSVGYGWCNCGAGGGGYSGGGAGQINNSGGGGGSFNSGTAQTNTAGNNTGNGYVAISYATSSVVCTGPSQNFTITVNPTPVVNAVANQTVCNGGNTAVVNFSSPTTGGTIVYDWTNSDPSIGLAASGSGNIASFVATNSGTAPVTATITVTPSYTNAAVTCVGAPITFTITVNPTATINTVANQNLCNGALTSAINFSSPTTGGTIVYNWTNTTPSIGLAASGSGDIAPFVATNTTNNPVIATITVTPAFTNGITCNGTPITFTITVYPTPQVDQPVNQVICNNTSTAPVNFTSPTTGSIINYSWTNNDPSIGLAASGTGNIASFIGTNATNAPVTATITVTPANSVNNALSFNGGNQVNVTSAPTIPVGNSPYTIEAWVRPNTVFGAQGIIGWGAWSNVNQVNAFRFNGPTQMINYWWGNDLVVNTPNVLDGNWHHVVATFDGTTRSIYFDGALAGSDNPTGHNVPFANNLTIARTCPHCPGGEFFDGRIDEMRIWNVGKTQAQILASMNSTVASNSPGLAAYYRMDEGSGSFTADLTGNANHGNNFINNPAWMTPSTAPFSNVVCVGPPKTFTITVNPTATVNAVANQTVCNGANTTAVSFSSPTTSGTIVYNWTNNDPSIGLAASGTGNIASFVGTNTTNAPVTATITVTPTFTNGVSCVGTPITFTITVNPTATVNAVANQTVCNGANTTAVNFSSPTTGGTIVYNWTNNDPSIGLAASGTGNIASFVGTNTTNAPVTATITVTPTFTNVVSCVGTPITFTITVNPTPIVNAVANQVVCNNSSTVVNFSSPTTGGTLVYNWTNTNPAIGLGASGSGNLSFTSTNTTPDPITGTITVTPSFTNNGVTCIGAPISFTITVNPTVVITQVADMVVCNGASTPVVNFTTATSIGTVVYNWTNTNPAIGLAASGTGNIGSFVATNTTNAPISGTITVTPTYINIINCVGTPMTFTVTVNPTATVNAVANQVVCNGSNTTAVNFSSPTTGGTIVYNWTNNDPSIGLAASGTGNIASFVATNAGTAPVVATITVTPAYTNGGTTCNGTPLTFTITVNPTATINTVANQVVCNGANTTAINFSSPATGGTIVYNWTNNDPSIGLAANGSGNIASFVATNATNAPVIATITVTPTYTNGVSCVGTPITFTITVNPTATVDVVANQLLCNGANTTAVNFSSPATGGTIVYNWTNNAPSIGLAASGSGNIASFIATNATNAPVVATITVTPAYTNAGVTCNGTPRTFTITVNPTAVVNQVTNQVVCNGLAVPGTSFTSPTTGGTIVYNWTNSDPSIGLAASGTGSVPGFIGVNATNAPVTAIITVTPTYTNGISCVGTPMIYTITVNPTAVMDPVPNQVVCNGANTTATNFTSPTTGGLITYNWSNNNPSIGLAAGGVGNIPSFVATNATNTPVVATITVTPAITNGGLTCDGTPRTFTITVNPTPNATANPTTQTACSGAPITTIVLTGTVPGTVYNWVRDNTINVTGIVSGTGNISGSLVNTTNVQQTVTYTITPTYTNGGVTCSGAPITATVIIPAPITITCPANITVNAAPGTCAVNVNFAATATGTPTPTITYSHAPGSSFTVGTTTVTATATNSCGTVSCTFTITVVDVRVPVMTTQPTDQTICEASSVTFTAAATNATGYQWQTYNGTGWVNIPGATNATLTLTNVSLNMHLSLYRVQVTGPCGTVTTSLFVTLRINALPTIQLSPSIFPTLLVPGQVLTITATGIQPGAGFFTWRKNGVIIPGVTGNVLTGLTIADQGVITATYTDANGCTSLPKSITIGALQTVSFFLYPNPNQGDFHISFYNQLNEQVTVLIYNSGNQLVYQRVHGSGTLPYSVIDINLGSRLADGQYVLLLMNAKGERVGTKQFIIHRQ